MSMRTTNTKHRSSISQRQAQRGMLTKNSPWVGTTHAFFTIFSNKYNFCLRELFLRHWQDLSTPESLQSRVGTFNVPYHVLTLLANTDKDDKQDVKRITHQDNIGDLLWKGEVLERRVLTCSVKVHLNNRIFVNGDKYHCLEKDVYVYGRKTHSGNDGDWLIFDLRWRATHQTLRFSDRVRIFTGSQTLFAVYSHALVRNRDW